MQFSRDVEELAGKYRRIVAIGHGGMADVYLAVARGPFGFNKLVVLKSPRAEMTQDPELQTMFLDEARLAARLSHHNIVQTYEVVREGDRFFIAMEYLDGQPLNRVRQRCWPGGGLSFAMEMRVFCDVLAALEYAHELTDFDGRALSVVHRDVTPPNVFVTYDGQVKLVDFGVAKTTDSLAETHAGVIKGKISYMSPEQARGERVDRRTDIFAVGVMIWEAACKRRMWEGHGDVMTLHRLMDGDIVPLSAIRSDAPAAIVDVCARALAPRREDRYATAAEMLADIERRIGPPSERAATRELARLVTNTFAAERARLRGIIEARLREGQPDSDANNLPRIDSVRLSIPSHPGSIVVTLPPEQPPQSPVPPASGEEVAHTVRIRPLFRPWQRTAAILTVTAAALVAIAALQWRERARHEDDSATFPLPPRGGLSRIRVSPPEARLLVDGVEISVGSYEGRLPDSDTGHELRVEAPGYVTRVLHLPPGPGVSIHIALDPVRGAGAPPQ